MPAGLNVPTEARPTRGDGLLEGVIASLRIRAALNAIKPSLHDTEILDIGCGSYPRFLVQAPFHRKVGLDQIASARAEKNIEILQVSLATGVRLPFPDSSFSCISSLAVIEHLEPAGLSGLMQEIYRVLKPGGQMVLTTPHGFADGILRVMARLNLVSKEEIEEHKSLFFHRHIHELLLQGGFPAPKIKVQGFLLGLNILAVAEK